MAVDAVAFDFGGVVIRTPFEMAAGLEDRLDLPRGSIDLAGPFDPDADPLRRRFRAGEFTELEYWHRQADRHAELIGAGPDRLRSFIDALFDAPREEVIRPETWDLQSTLRSLGMRLAVLTNDLSRFHDPAWNERMQVLDRFDPFVDLSNTGILKRDPRSYLRLLERIELPADRVLFVDDQPVNIAGAEKVGMQTVHFDVLDRPASISRVLVGRVDAHGMPHGCRGEPELGAHRPLAGSLAQADTVVGDGVGVGFGESGMIVGQPGGGGPAQMARVEAGEDPTVGFPRTAHQRIELPCEKKKLGATIDFASRGLTWARPGTHRHWTLSARSISRRPGSAARRPAPMSTPPPNTSASIERPRSFGPGSAGLRRPLVGPRPGQPSGRPAPPLPQLRRHRNGRGGHYRRVLGGGPEGVPHLVQRLRLGRRHREDPTNGRPRTRGLSGPCSTEYVSYPVCTVQNGKLRKT